MALQPSNRKKNNSRRNLILILALVLAMIGGAYMMFFGGANKRAQPQVQPPGMVAMPVVKADLPSGTRISNKMYRIKYVRPNEVPTDALLSTAQFVGRYATRPIANGEYVREGDITEPGAHKGFSGFAKYGKRSVVLDGKLFPGMAESINIGDRIDLLSIGTPSGAGAGRRGALTRAQQSANSIEGGGTMPGDTLVRRLARQGGLGNTVSATTATLIAEDAEVVAVPKPRTRRSPGINYFVLQMEPEQAHITMLSVASGATLRAVFRPFSDRSRVTPVHTASSTVRSPKPLKDPDAITIIAGSSRTLQMPYSKIYRSNMTTGGGIDNEDDLGEEGEVRTNSDGMVPLQNSDAGATNNAPAPAAPPTATTNNAPATNNNTLNIVDDNFYNEY